MFKILYIFYAEILILLILATLSDSRTYKISNSINYSFILLGILSNTAFYGLRGLMLSLFGAFVPIAILFILFALRMLGAGDIKLFCAIGAIMGLEFVLYSIVLAIFFGGIIALLVILIRKNAIIRFTYFLTYIKSCMISFSILPYCDFEDKTDGGKMHFSYAVACGTLLLIAAQPFTEKLI